MTIFIRLSPHRVSIRAQDNAPPVRDLAGRSPRPYRIEPHRIEPADPRGPIAAGRPAFTPPAQPALDDL
ncbi:hypothetical protein [Pseudomonas sp. CGJS7]|uniref:hypothetical protein n=1 Tax=Pseudomonas sp. CGJS7 TaxID=3109348 RepID=UPI00300A613C